MLAQFVSYTASLGMKNSSYIYIDLEKFSLTVILLPWNFKSDSGRRVWQPFLYIDKENSVTQQLKNPDLGLAEDCVLLRDSLQYNGKILFFYDSRTSLSTSNSLIKYKADSTLCP